jgi:hypothetical protein
MTDDYAIAYMIETIGAENKVSEGQTPARVGKTFEDAKRRINSLSVQFFGIKMYPEV